MAHNHDHSPQPITNLNRAFIIGIVLNLGYVILQIIIGFRINSLSLLSDAGHNFLDVMGLAASLIAFQLAKKAANQRYTYGYRQATVLITLANAIALLLSIGAIAYEALLRFYTPSPVEGTTIAIIAAIGIIINGVSAMFFFRDKDKDINVKSAFLHLAADAIVSLALVIGGIIIHYTHIFWIDPLLSLLVCAVIIKSTWSLLRESLRLSLNGVPFNINIDTVKEKILSITGITNVHHIHIWALSTTQNALTATLIIDSNTPIPDIMLLKNKVKHELQHLNIHHTTLEFDTQLPSNDPLIC